MRWDPEPRYALVLTAERRAAELMDPGRRNAVGEKTFPEYSRPWTGASRGSGGGAAISGKFWRALDSNGRGMIRLVRSRVAAGLVLAIASPACGRVELGSRQTLDDGNEAHDSGAAALDSGIGAAAAGPSSEGAGGSMLGAVGTEGPVAAAGVGGSADVPSDAAAPGPSLPKQPAPGTSADAGSADRRSCAAAPRCGVEGDSCCARSVVPAGPFQLGQAGESPGVPAFIDRFYLAAYEVTVGRFAEFVADYDTWRTAGDPRAGAGQYDGQAASGWQERWQTALPANAAELRSSVSSGCPALASFALVDSRPDLPMNCVSWFEAFTFCLWDGARLPTELEWEYAARGGEQLRPFPWQVGAEPAALDTVGDEVVFNCARPNDVTTEPCVGENLPSVGSFPAGTSRWLQKDLAGSLAEWVFDGFSEPYPPSCSRCVQTGVESRRVVRGGSWFDLASDPLLAAYRNAGDPAYRDYWVGFRCAATEYR